MPRRRPPPAPAPGPPPNRGAPRAGSPPPAAARPPARGPGAVPRPLRRLSEDWIATALGLVLLTLVLTGVLTDGLVP